METLVTTNEESLSDEEAKEIYEDIEADYWINYDKENP